MKPFHLSEIAAIPGLSARFLSPAGTADLTLVDVSTDSRFVQPGGLFLALKGPNADGHRYIPSAIENGAAAVVASEDGYRSLAESGAQPRAWIIVPDTLDALGRIAGWHASRMPARRVAVTGSSGKTTTKEMLAAMLSGTGPTLRNPGSQNGETGVPLTLLRLEERHEFTVIEMGMRGAGQIRSLAEITRPEIGVITMIGRAHQEFLGSIENIARAKGELLECLPPGGVAILPHDDPMRPILRSLCRCRVATHDLDSNTERATDEKDPAADFRAAQVHLSAEGSAFVAYFPDGRRHDVTLPLPGIHNIRNAVAALGAAWSLDADLSAAVSALATFIPPDMRSARFRTFDGIHVLNDAYNANPDSMRAALDVLAACPPRRIAILGDMLEIGEGEEREHESLGRDAAPRIDALIAVGPRSKATVEGARKAGLPTESIEWFADSVQAAASVRSMTRPGDTVLVKGSRGCRMEAIIETLSNDSMPAEGKPGEEATP